MGYEFFGEKIIFPSAPVLGINNDQSLTSSNAVVTCPNDKLNRISGAIFTSVIPFFIHL